uniref:Uncharacterized protein n=1 Tax=Bradyrhizobium amphicarpaeae TaxID=1404768 RepID=A0A2U8PST5_9BRAD|nr:hypothetical protein CIT40_11285 [Bradyrhizobium amphicarpaeae]
MSVPDGVGTNTGVIARLVRNCAQGRAIQYSRGANGIRRGRGVLDSPPWRGMTAVFVGRSRPTGPPGSADMVSGRSLGYVHPRTRCSAHSRGRRSR